jgi:hypothetical protein
LWNSFAAAFHARIIPKARPKRESDLLKPGRWGDGTHVGGIVDAFEEAGLPQRVCIVTDTLTSSPLFMNYAAATAGHQFPF